ncbi:31_t:CDS:2 [Entrophospora sp. SA101]|nr:31_t:CDS:2 [Entrophospora sp. SA101]
MLDGGDLTPGSASYLAYLFDRAKKPDQAIKDILTSRDGRNQESLIEDNLTKTYNTETVTNNLTTNYGVGQNIPTVSKPANDETKPQISDSSRSTNMKSSISEDSHADISQIIETKDSLEEATSKTNFIENDQIHATKTEMVGILPVGAIFMYPVLAFLINVVIWLVVVKPIRDG